MEHISVINCILLVFYTVVPANVNVNGRESGTMGEERIMRYVLNNITQDGVSIRFCISEGEITFYVAQDFLASAANYDNTLTIAKRDSRLNVECNTVFTDTYGTSLSIQKRQAMQTSVVYVTIEGHGNVNTFTMQSGHGNISFGKCVSIVS